MMSVPIPSPAPPRVIPACDPFAEQVAALAPLVRAVASATLRAAPAHADVKDVVSETLRRAIEGRERLRQGAELRAWVVGIARHVALDVLRARARSVRRATPDGPTDSSPSPVEAVPDPAPSPLDRVVSAEQAAIVARALQTLPERSREALVLFHVEGLSYAEIAVRLGVPLGTVATWILRARRALADVLAQERERRAR